MSEPESLDTDEPLGKRIERHAFDRLIMLSDGVFAIAMTLLALEVKPPEQWDGTLGGLLAETWRPLFGYALSFLMIGAFWFANRGILARVRRVDGPFTALTLLFLCLICLAPPTTALMAHYGPGRSMKAFSILVAAAGTVQLLLWLYAAFWRRLIDVHVSRQDRLFMLIGFLLMPSWFALIAVAMGPGGREWLLAPPMVVAFILGRLWRKRTRRRLAAS